jgi:hypothetical protein
MNEEELLLRSQAFFWLIFGEFYSDFMEMTICLLIVLFSIFSCDFGFGDRCPRIEKQKRSRPPGGHRSQGVSETVPALFFVPIGA